MTVERQRRFSSLEFDLKLQADGKAGTVPHHGLDGQLEQVVATLGGGGEWGCSISNLAVKYKYTSTLKIKSPLNKIWA